MLSSLKSKLSNHRAISRNRKAAADGAPLAVWTCQAQLGEGPVWSAEDGLLRFVDIPGRQLLSFDTETGAQQQIPMEGNPSALIPLKDNSGFLLAMDTCLWKINRDFSHRELFLDLEIDPSQFRCNDAKADPMGRLWLGIMRRDGDQPDGKQLIISPDGKVTSWLEDLTIPNGPAFNASFDRGYLADSPKRILYSFEIDPDGNPGVLKPFKTFTEADGYPDGMTVDDEGYLWVAHYDGARISRFSPEGQLDRAVELPARNVTSLTFAGPGWDQVYITTAKESPTDQYILSGALFHWPSPVKGFPPHSFGA